MNYFAITAVACSLVLGGCGGSGGGDATPAPPPAPPPPAPPPPVNQAPAAAFTIAPNQGTRPLLVHFNASASADPDGMIQTYGWDFGEPPGSSSVTGATTTHTYASTGSFTVLLRVSDDDGASATTTRTVTVNAPLAAIAGTIQILSSSAIDSDVNDISSPPTPNNDFASAQALPNPVTLGGFANLAMTGEAGGNLFSTGDPGDFYTLTMTDKDVATLHIADSATAELALYIYDTAQNLIDADDGPGATHSVEVTDEGIYFIEVRPMAGASNYVLTVGQDLLPSRSSWPALTDAFVPGEILLEAGDIAALEIDYGLNEIAQSGELALVRTLGADATLKRLGRPSPFDHRWSARKREKYATRAMIKALADDHRTRIAEPNYLRYPHTEPNDTFYASQWHYPAINLPLAWDITTGDSSVIVAVVDTGVLLTHPDLDDQIVAGFDFINDPDRARDGDGRDSDPTDEGDLAFGGSSSFHGTHVSGTVAAETDTDAIGP
ncbi:MAG: PKD domain-containing protein, partial [Gammaproteobacteria bacterium]|nr:PKD domain-containing protein [Gammaproteobacteria bacterium]